MRKIEQKRTGHLKKARFVLQNSYAVWAFFEDAPKNITILCFLKSLRYPGGALLVLKFFFKIKTTHLRGTISLQGALCNVHLWHFLCSVLSELRS